MGKSRREVLKGPGQGNNCVVGVFLSPKTCCHSKFGSVHTTAKIIFGQRLQKCLRFTLYDILALSCLTRNSTLVSFNSKCRACTKILKTFLIDSEKPFLIFKN